MLFFRILKTFLGTALTFMTTLMIFGRNGLVSVKRVQLRDNQLPWISQKQICTVYVIDFIRYIFVHQQT